MQQQGTRIGGTVDAWTLLRLAAFAMTPVWVFSAAWALVVGVPVRHRATGRRAVSVFGPVAAGVVRPAAGGAPDPFRTLALQRRLTALAAELDALAVDDGSVYARGARLVAVSAAYDDVLADACALAGVPPQRGRDVRREVGRLMEEAALRGAGWTW